MASVTQERARDGQGQFAAAVTRWTRSVCSSGCTMCVYVVSDIDATIKFVVSMSMIIIIITLAYNKRVRVEGYGSCIAFTVSIVQLRNLLSKYSAYSEIP